MAIPACLPHCGGSDVSSASLLGLNWNKIIITSWDMTGTTRQLQVQVTGTAGPRDVSLSEGNGLIVAG